MPDVSPSTQLTASEYWSGYQVSVTITLYGCKFSGNLIFPEIIRKFRQKPGSYSVKSLIFLGAVLKTTECIKLKHKDLESSLSRISL